MREGEGGRHAGEAVPRTSTRIATSSGDAEKRGEEKAHRLQGRRARLRCLGERHFLGLMRAVSPCT